MQKPGLQRPPYMQPGMQPVTRAQRGAGHQRFEQRRVIDALDFPHFRRGLAQLGNRIGQRLAIFPGPQARRPLLAECPGQCLRGGHMGVDQRGEIVGAAFQPGRQRPQAMLHDIQQRLERRRFFRVRRQQFAQASDSRGGAGSAQDFLFEVADKANEPPAFHATGRDRVFQGGKQDDGRQTIARRARHQPQEHGRRRVRQRATGGIVDRDAPAAQLRRHPARQLPVWRNQGRRLAVLFQCMAQHQGDDAGFLRLVGAIHPLDAVKRGARDRPQRAPDVRGLGRAQGLARQHGAFRRAGEFSAGLPLGNGLRRHFQPLQKPQHAELRMGRLIAHRPLRCLVHAAIQAGQDDPAHRQAHDDLQQVGGGRDAAGGARRDDRCSRWRIAP